MRRPVLAALLSTAVATSAWAKEPPPNTASSDSAATAGPSAKAVDDAFATLVMLAEKAHREGHLKDAITAYQKALALRDDAVVTGRLGVLYAIAGAPEMATRNLLVALERGGPPVDVTRALPSSKTSPPAEDLTKALPSSSKADDCAAP